MKIRDIFFHGIYQLVKEGEDIVVVSSDLGAPSLDSFRKDFPNRFINVGIAEQNLIAVASGLQLAGKKVVAYGLNPFPVTRAFDQVRNLMASLQIPITLTALNAGTCSADAGYTHMPIENIAVLRTLKNVQILNPSDETTIRKLLREIVENPKPRYVQFDKFIEGSLYSESDICCEKGFATKNQNCKVVIVSSGIMAHNLMKSKVPAKIIDCFSLPIQEEEFVKELNGCKQVITVEDGVLPGGIGSMVLEILSDFNVAVPVKRFGLRFCQGYPERYVNREMVFHEQGLTIAEIERYVHEVNGE